MLDLSSFSKYPENFDTTGSNDKYQQQIQLLTVREGGGLEL